MKILQRASALAALLTIAFSAPATAAKTMQFAGRVEHVSADNLKVRDTVHHKTMSFLLVPHFDRVFAFDGKTTFQMKKIHPGMFVRVTYDQRALGARHADRILLLNAYGRGVEKIGS